MASVRSFFLLGLLVVGCSAEFLPWVYQCDSKHDRCMRIKVADKALIEEISNSPTHESTPADDAAAPFTSFAVCKLTCRGDDQASGEAEGDQAHFSILWPMPRKVEKLGSQVTHFDAESVEFGNEAEFKDSPTGEMIKRNIKEQVDWMKLKKKAKAEAESKGVSLVIRVNFESDPAAEAKPRIRKNVDEKYTLNIYYAESEKKVYAEIGAKDYFGARHGLETLFQLTDYDDVARAYAVVSDVKLSDWPEFPHRGVSVDTSRNFVDVDTLKRIVDGLAHDKLNVFHWHIVDTHSFPFELKGDLVKKITEYGAYSPSQVYTQAQIRDFVEYANYRGVRVIPELDQPAHVGNGWNFPGGEKLTTCVNKEPWYSYCVEPPCGQLDPTEPLIYDYLEKIYDEMVSAFDFDSFHMGADEVHFGCWNSSERVQDWMKENDMDLDEEGFISIWRDFQIKSSNRLRKSFTSNAAASSEDGEANHLDIIVWTSHLTHEKWIDYGLPKEDYTVQIWTDGSNTNDPQIKVLADKGYKMIFSNYDALYMDCGFGAWVGSGNNWCSPYKGWQKVYQNDPYDLLDKRYVVLTEENKKLVQGAEVAIWSEQVDSTAVESRLFPRASALAERLWSNPGQDWYRAQSRLLHQRTRMVQRGIRADAIQPEWCEQNERQCYSTADNPTAKKEEESEIDTRAEEVASISEEEAGEEKPPLVVAEENKEE